MTRYIVTGPTAFDGHAPGDTFEAELDAGQEERAIARGSIAKAAPPKTDVRVPFKPFKKDD